MKTKENKELTKLGKEASRSSTYVVYMPKPQKKEPATTHKTAKK